MNEKEAWIVQFVYDIGYWQESTKVQRLRHIESTIKKGVKEKSNKESSTVYTVVVTKDQSIEGRKD